LKSWSDIDEYTICNTVSSKAKTGTVIENFSHAGASGGQFILDIEAQVFFFVNAKNSVGLEPCGWHFDAHRLFAFTRSMCQRSSRGL
jgi:hypothetical protein